MAGRIGGLFGGLLFPRIALAAHAKREAKKAALAAGMSPREARAVARIAKREAKARLSTMTVEEAQELVEGVHRNNRAEARQLLDEVRTARQIGRAHV